VTRARVRICWATDVHLNFLDERGLSAFREAIAREEADLVVITGDIAEAPSFVPLLVEVAEALRLPIYFVLGNHDYYRSSIASVRTEAAAIGAHSRWLHWLPARGIVELAPDVGLIGVDGWADARLGDYDRSPVLLNDYLLIEDLAGLDKQARREKLGRLGDDEAAALRGPLAEALGRYQRVIVATHVPPFKDACWYEGRISNDEWLPHFTCKAVGDALREAAAGAPDRKVTVLCGHTHGAGKAEILPNLKVRTGGAEYGEPRIQGVIELQ
jgi:Icc protein